MSLLEKIPFLSKFSIDDIEEKLDLFRKYQHYLYISINLIILTQLYFSIIAPEFSSYEKERQKLTQLKTLYENKKEKARDEQSIQSEISTLSDSLRIKQKVFFTSDEIKKFSFTEINNICKYFDLKLNSINLKKNALVKEKVSSSPLVLEFTGDFFNIMDFIYKLETYQKIISVDSLSMRTASIDPIILRVSMTINLHTITKS